MESLPSAYALAPGDGDHRWGTDGALTSVKATGDRTGEQLAVIEDFAPRGEGTPLHAHHDDHESFYVLEGDLTFWLGDAPPVRASAGWFVHIPGGVPHAFRVESETARYLIVTTPQHGRFYEAISEPAPTRSLPPPAPMDMDKVEAACARFGVEVLGPPPHAQD